MKKIAILGSTGSIGTQALEIIENNPDRFKVTVLSCGKNIELISEQIKKFKPLMAIAADENDALKLSRRHSGTEISYGVQGLIDGVKISGDMVLNSLVGMMGLVPTYYAIKAGKDIALANKETLVAGGQLIMDMAKSHKVKILPVDSEHSAIFQALQGNEEKAVKRIMLTASGGPFRGYNLNQLKKVTLEQALNHPKWSMGSKITIDSATMMNKGLEIIEAKWLFNICPEKIKVVIHPQSIIHSMVEYVDNSIIAQMGVPDMRVPISYAFGFPDRVENPSESLDLFNQGAELTFQKPDLRTFRCIAFAYEAIKKGGSYPVVLNGANEVLVQMFLEEKISFLDIQNNVEKIMNSHVPTKELTLESIIEIDKRAREEVRRLL